MILEVYIRKQLGGGRSLIRHDSRRDRSDFFSYHEHYQGILPLIIGWIFPVTFLILEIPQVVFKLKYTRNNAFTHRKLTQHSIYQCNLWLSFYLYRLSLLPNKDLKTVQIFSLINNKYLKHGNGVIADRNVGKTSLFLRAKSFRRWALRNLNLPLHVFVNNPFEDYRQKHKWHNRTTLLEKEGRIVRPHGPIKDILKNNGAILEKTSRPVVDLFNSRIQGELT